MPNILAFSDSTDSCLELISLGSQLGGQVSVAVLGSGDLSAQSKKLSVTGVSNIYEVAHDSLANLLAGPSVDALEAVSKKINPDLVADQLDEEGKGARGPAGGQTRERLHLGCHEAINPRQWFCR